MYLDVMTKYAKIKVMTLENVAELPDDPTENSTGHLANHKIIHGALKEIAADLAVGSASGLADRGNWVASTSYSVGDVVTAQYARWYCKAAHTATSTFEQSNWLHLGLYAVGSATDPGFTGGLWVQI